MRLKYKAMIMALISVIVLVGLTYGIFYYVFYGYIDAESKDQMAESFRIVEQIVANEKDNLNIILQDWAYWDDTYQYISDKNQAYATSNLQKETLEFLNLSMMVMVNQNGNIIGFQDYDLSQETSDRLVEKLKQNNFYTGTLTLEEDAKTNLVLINGQAYFVAAALVNNSSHSTVSNGSVVLIRPFNGKIADYIETMTGLSVQFRESLGPLTYSERDVTEREFDGKFYLTSSKLQEDSYGEETVNMTISRKATNYNFVKNQFNWFIMGFLLVVFLIVLVDYFILNRIFFVRLKKLKDFLDEVGRQKDTSMSINLKGSDELNTLATSTNEMLSAIDSANEKMKMMDERYRLIMEATNDGYLDLWVNTREVYISSAWKELIGYTGEDGQQLFLDYFSKIHEECKKRLEASFMNMIQGKFDYFEEEYRVTSELYGIIWVSHRGKVVQRDENNKAVRFISTLSNITRRKINEEEILFLSYSDPLTRLKNRAYMKKQFEILNQENDVHYFIIMCDINGLKLTNDAFGHQEGDQILIAVSNVLRRVCRPTDLISRWPGDEFVMIIKDRNQDEVCKLINQITSEIEKIRDFHLNISVAIGYAESSAALQTSEDVLKLAENRMYRNKLMESASSRNATISSLARTLHEKSTETEEHTMRIKQLSSALGSKLGLRKDEMDELQLLSLLHDIGKIGIPEYILDKPSKLTDDEWRIIKTHPEIGNRIAKSTPALEHIADEILAHHEKYDGTGYPNGIKGEDIPYLGRIISVVDAFDVMTHSRSYKKANDLSYAISELENCSGTQFDPDIVTAFLEMIQTEGVPVTLEI